MRDGNVYITQKPPRIHSTLTLDRLVHQALAIAQKVDSMIAGRIGKKGLKK